MLLSKRSLELLATLFAENSNLTLPVGVAAEVLEIRTFVQSQFQKINDVVRSVEADTVAPTLPKKRGPKPKAGAEQHVE